MSGSTVAAMRRLQLTSMLLLVGALALTGCSSGMGSSPEMARDDAGIRAPSVDFGESAGGDAGIIAGRQVIVTGQVILTVENPAEAADAATQLVEKAGGHVAGRTETAPRDDRG